MNDERKARLFLGATSTLVASGLILQFILTIARDSGLGAFESTPSRILNFFSFFTVQSNILVAGAIAEDRNGNDYYAYLFMNVQVHGYAVALIRCAIVAALFLGLSFAALAVDKRLLGVQAPVTDAATRSRPT